MPDSAREGARPGWARLQALGVPFLVKMLAGCPWGVVEWIFGAISLGQALLEPSRAQRALGWATSQGRSGRARWALALALLVNRGRFLALATVPAFAGPERLRGRLAVEGIERLRGDAWKGGAILLGFHLGPPGQSAALEMAGYSYTSAGRSSHEAVAGQTGPSAASAWTGRTHRPASNPVPRAAALYRVRALLLAGETVRLMADGRWGHEAFAVPTPGGGRLVIRPGWWMLRRQTGALAFPVLTHREGRRLVAVVHPPLPPAAPDAREDITVCQRALALLLEDYVRRFPEQCVALAFRPAEDQAGAPVAAG